MLLYLFSLVALLNSCTNSSIVFSFCFNFFNSATLTVFSSLLLNSFFMSTKNSSTVSYSNTPTSRSSKIFSFYTYAEHPYIYDEIHCICSSPMSSLILILMNNLHAIINPETFSKLLSNTCGLTTSVLDLVLGLGAAPLFCNVWSCAYIAAGCSYYCLMIACKSMSWQLIVYISSEIGESDNGSGNRIGSGDIYKEKVKLVLISLSDLYSELNLISVCVSRFSSNLTSYFLLTIFLTNYCLKEKVNNFGLRRLSYSRQDFKNTCYSPV